MASISVDDLGAGRFKVRWRELLPDANGRPHVGPDGRLVRRARSLVVVGKPARDELVASIRRALLEEGEYQLATASVAPVEVNLERAALAWLAFKRTRCTASSVRRYGQYMARFFAAARELRAIPATKAIMASVLTRDLLIGVVGRWQAEGLSEAFAYGASRAALEMWRWVSDDPATYPGVPTPPRVANAVLPPSPVYFAPPAPTLAECDACLRHLSLDAVQSRRIGTLLRYTGLRVFQVVALRRKDFDLVNATLTVTTGKSRIEKATMRTVPIARGLVGEIAPWTSVLGANELLFPAWGVAGSERKASMRSDAFTNAWEEATRWGEAREVAWKPANRKIARPEHAFRAGFQAALRVAGAAEAAIDELVGHHGKTVRARHYVGSDSLWEPMRAAVDAMPPIDWLGPKELPNEKVVRLRG